MRVDRGRFLRGLLSVMVLAAALLLMAHVYSRSYREAGDERPWIGTFLVLLPGLFAVVSFLAPWRASLSRRVLGAATLALFGFVLTLWIPKIADYFAG